MKCPNCNAEISDKSKFCSKCGAKIETGSPVEENKQEETVPCIKCGAELKKGAKFCAKCGASQSEEPKPEPKAEPKAESKAEPKPEPKPEPKADPKPAAKAIPPMPVQPWKSEPKQEAVPPKRKKSPIGLIVAVIVVVVVAAVVWAKGAVGDNTSADNDTSAPASYVPEGQSQSAMSSEASVAASEGNSETAESTEATVPSQDTGVKGDPALLDAVDEKVTAAENALADGAYTQALEQGEEAISQYMTIARENNLKEEALAKIQRAFQTVSSAAVTYGTRIEEQELGSAGFKEVRNTTDPIVRLLDDFAQEGYVIDVSEFTAYEEGVIPRFRDYYIRKINEITDRAQWSRDEAWTYAHQAYSIQDNGETLLFDEYDLEDPLQMRFVYCRGWIYRKRCETGLADGSMTNEDAFNYMIEVLKETDYNLLVLDDLIKYGQAAGKDVTKYQEAYDAIIEELKTEQGLEITDNGDTAGGTKIDVKKFWYFNDLDGAEDYKVDDRNGTTKATRKWIRENIPEYFK